MPKPDVDFIIIGQGLAGSLLAFCLIQRGQKVMVVDNQHYGSSTQVAAGVINPVTGHRLNITESFASFWAAAEPFYNTMQTSLGTQLYRQIKQDRLIKNQGQSDYLNKRLTQPAYDSLLQQSENTLFKNAPYGCVSVRQTAVVDTKVLLSACRAWLESSASILTQKVDYSNILFSADSIKYDGITASNLIFCEGFQAIYNPWLKHLPFKLAKGEILTVRAQPASDTFLNWGHWLVPSTDGYHKLGSNFDWNDTSLGPTVSAKEKMLNNANETLKSGLEVVDQEAGIRPTTTQRKPFVGPVTGLKNTYCLNGLGSKGCLLAPYYATLLCDHILADRALPEELTQWL